MNVSSTDGLCLVVGGAGFLGRALVRRLLAQGFAVRVFDRVAAFGDDPRVDVRVGDVRDAAAVERAVRGVRSVFQTAALIELNGVVRRAERQRVMDVNVGGTQRLLEAAGRQGVRDFVFTSSNNVCLGPAVRDGDERVPRATHFVDLYSESKVRSEQIVLEADGRKGVRTCALRPGGIWGPGPGCFMLERLLTALAKGQLLATIGDGRTVSDNTHVENLVDAQLGALEGLRARPEQVGGQAYFVTDGEPMNPVDWFRPLCAALGEPLPNRQLPGRLMYGVGYAAEWVRYLTGWSAGLNRLEVLKVIRDHSFRSDKAHRELGYAPRVTLRNGGIDECVPWARLFMAQVRRGVR